MENIGHQQVFKSSHVSKSNTKESEIKMLQNEVEKLAKKIKRRPKMLVGKPGLDGHSNGAEQIAVRSRDIGLEVVYEGIRSTPEQLVVTAIEEECTLLDYQFVRFTHTPRKNNA